MEWNEKKKTFEKKKSPQTRKTPATATTTPQTTTATTAAKFQKLHSIFVYKWRERHRIWIIFAHSTLNSTLIHAADKHPYNVRPLN